MRLKAEPRHTYVVALRTKKGPAGKVEYKGVHIIVTKKYGVALFNERFEILGFHSLCHVASIKLVRLDG